MSGDSSTPADARSSDGAETAAVVERVWALDSFGRPDDALAEVRRGLAEFPESAELLGSLAWLEFFHGDRERSEAAARQTLAVRPDDWRGLNMLVENAVARGAFDEAEATARQMVAALPNWEGSYLGLAYTLVQPRKDGRRALKRRREEVRDCVATAVELAPEQVETLRRGSILLAHAGEEERSAALLSRALEIDPTNEELLLLVAGSGGTSELEGLRVLSGVLTENPQQRDAARRLSESVWARTTWLASFLLLVLVGLLLFGYLVFQEGIETTYWQRRQIGSVFVVAVLSWFMVLVLMGRVLPRGYLRRMFNAVWWVWLGIALAALGFLATGFIAFAFAVRSLPAQYHYAGGYIGGLTATLDFVVWLVLIAELLIVFAQYASERRNQLFPGDADGLGAARWHLRSACIALLVRGGAAVLLVLVPVLATGIATRPEAAGAFPAVAVAVAVPPGVRVLLALATVSRARAEARGGVGRSGVALAAALVIGACGIGGAWALAAAHQAEFDPPPTPFELEQRERIENMRESLDEINHLDDVDFDGMAEGLRETTERLRELSERSRGELGLPS